MLPRDPMVPPSRVSLCCQLALVFTAWVFVVPFGQHNLARAENEPAIITGTPIRGKPIRAVKPPATAPLVTNITQSGSAKAPEPSSPGFSVVGFDQLASFPYEVNDTALTTTNGTNIPDQIPANIKAFDRQSIALKGFMLPLKVEKGLVTEMLLMRDQSMCCYGKVPKINEWVTVKMTGAGVKPVMDLPVILKGKLEVGETRENGYLTGIYRMDGVTMEESQ